MSGTVYLDTSAAAKLLVEEAESAALARYLDEHAEDGGRVVSSVLLETELRRLATRQELSQAAVTVLLDGVGQALPDRVLYRSAGLLHGPRLRSLDALHLASALRLDADAIAVYDARLAAAADAVGLRVVAPA